MDASSLAARAFPGRLAELAAAVAGTALVGFRALHAGPPLTDSAAITFAYVRSLDAGLGPVAQTGESPSDGFASPVWVLALLVGRRTGLFDGSAGLTWFPFALAVVCLAGALLAVSGAARALRCGPAWAVGLLGGAAFAANGPLVAWLFSGHAGPLYVLGLALVCRALAAGVAGSGSGLGGGLDGVRTAAGCGLAAALAASARPGDGWWLAAAYPVALAVWALPRAGVLPSWRAVGAYAAGFGLPCAALLGWRQAAFGHWLPAPGVDGPEVSGPALAVVAAATVLGAGWAAGEGRTRAGLAVALLPWGMTVLGGGPGWCAGTVAAPLLWGSAWQARRLSVRPLLAGAGVCGLLAVAVQPTAAAAGAEADGANPWCVAAERYGQTFPAYARHLGLTRGTVALPEPGAALLHGGGLDVLDLSGRTDPSLAAASAEGEAALRRIVLERARPEFVRLAPTSTAGAPRAGLSDELLRAHGYHRVTGDGDGGDYVHRSTLTAPNALPELRSWARTAAATQTPCT